MLPKYPTTFHTPDILEYFHNQVASQFIKIVQKRTSYSLQDTQTTTLPNSEMEEHPVDQTEQQEYEYTHQVQEINQLRRLCNELRSSNKTLTEQLLLSQSKLNSFVKDGGGCSFTDLVLDSVCLSNTSNVSKSGNPSQENDFSFPIPISHQKHITNIQCLYGSVQIHTMFNITNKNNRLELVLDGRVVSVYLTPGRYEIKDIVTHLETKLSKELGTNEFMMEYNEVINLVFIRNIAHKPFRLIPTPILAILGIKIDHAPDVNSESVGSGNGGITSLVLKHNPDEGNKCVYVSSDPPCTKVPLTCVIAIHIDTHPISNIVSDNTIINGSTVLLQESNQRNGVFYINDENKKDVWKVPLKEASRIYVRVCNQYETYEKKDISFQLSLRFFGINTNTEIDTGTSTAI